MHHAVPSIAGVVHDGVDLAVFLDGTLDKLVGKRGVRYVARNAEGFAAVRFDGVHHSRRRFFIAVADDHLRAVAGKQAGGRSANAPARTGDDDDLAIDEFSRHLID